MGRPGSRAHHAARFQSNASQDNAATAAAAGRPYEGEMGQHQLRAYVCLCLCTTFAASYCWSSHAAAASAHGTAAIRPWRTSCGYCDQNHAFAAAASLSRVLQAHQMAVAAAARNSSNSSQPGWEHGAGNPAEQHRQHQHQQQGPPPAHAPQYHMLPAGAMIPGMPAGAMPMYAPIFSMLVQQGPHGAPGWPNDAGSTWTAGQCRHEATGRRVPSGLNSTICSKQPACCSTAAAQHKAVTCGPEVAGLHLAGKLRALLRMALATVIIISCADVSSSCALATAASSFASLNASTQCMFLQGCSHVGNPPALGQINKYSASMGVQHR